MSNHVPRCCTSEALRAGAVVMTSSSTHGAPSSAAGAVLLDLALASERLGSSAAAAAWPLSFAGVGSRGVADILGTTPHSLRAVLLVSSAKQPQRLL